MSASWGAEALRCASHGGGEVAAAELAGETGEGRRGTARGEVGPEAAEVPCEAAGEAGGGLRPPSVAGGGAQRRRR